MIISQFGQEKRLNHLFFIITFVALIVVREFVLSGAYGISPLNSMFIIYGAMVVFSVVLIILARPANGAAPKRFQKSWAPPMSTYGIVVFALTAALVLWLTPIGFSTIFTSFAVRDVNVEQLFLIIAIQVLVVALAEELFFREALIRSFSENMWVAFLVNAITFFLFHTHLGIVPALIAVSAGNVYFALRYVGVPLLLIIILHGVTNVAFSRVFSISVGPMDGLLYAMVFLVATTAMALVPLTTKQQI